MTFKGVTARHLSVLYVWAIAPVTWDAQWTKQKDLTPYRTYMDPSKGEEEQTVNTIKK